MMFGRNFEKPGRNVNGKGHFNGHGNGQRDGRFYGRDSPVMQNLKLRFGAITLGNYRGCFQVMENLLEEQANNLYAAVDSTHFKILEAKFLRLLEEAEEERVIGTVPY